MRPCSSRLRVKKRIHIYLTPFKDKSKNMNEKLNNKTKQLMNWETNYEKLFEEKKQVRPKFENLKDRY